MNQDIYPYERMLQRLLKKVETDLEEDSDPVRKWYLYLKVDKNESLGLARIIKLLDNIVRISNRSQEKFGKRLLCATKDNIAELVGEIQDRKIAQLSMRDYNISIKKYITFLGKGDLVSWIKTYVSDKKRKLPEDMLTVSEVNLLIEKAQNPRDKALFALLNDVGPRIGEILRLRIKDVHFDDYGAYIVFPDGKTGARRVRLMLSIHYLKNWIENHPKPDPDNFLFVKLEKKLLFCWNKIPGIDNPRLIKFLNQRLDIEWITKAEIEKTNNGKTIILSLGKNLLSLTLNDEKTIVKINTEGNKGEELLVRKDKNDLNIYELINGRLVYTTARKALRSALELTGIKKRVHFHVFRHTAATRAAGFMTEQEMKAHFGWDQSSKMAAVYVHMSGEQVENKILTHYGLKKIDDNSDTMIKCPKCSRINPLTARFCGNCSCILDIKLLTQSDTVHEKISKLKQSLFESPEFVQILQKALENNVK